MNQKKTRRERILAIDLGPDARLRIQALQDKQKQGALSASEHEELHAYEESQRLLLELKARARNTLGLPDDPEDRPG